LGSAFGIPEAIQPQRKEAGITIDVSHFPPLAFNGAKCGAHNAKPDSVSDQISNIERGSYDRL